MMQFRRQLRRSDRDKGNNKPNYKKELYRQRLIKDKFREFHELVGKKREINRQLDQLRVEIDMLKEGDRYSVIGDR